MMKIIVFCLMGLSSYGFSQTSIAEKVNVLLQGALKDRAKLIELIEEPNQKEVNASLKVYLLDSTRSNRSAVIDFIKYAERNSSDMLIRKEQLQILFLTIEKLPLKDSKSALKVICNYEKSLFIKDQVDIVRDYLALPKIDKIQAIQLLGYIGETEDANYLNAMGVLYPQSKEEKYYVQLAQVRLKNADACNAYLEKFESVQIDDNFTTNLLKDAIYTRNQIVYKKLLEACLGDALNCYSANNDANVKIPCAYRILEAISPFIYDFPIKVDKTGEIEGDMEIELEKARSWIQAHINELMIIDNTF